MNWHGKPYYSLDSWFKNEYGGKLRKIALDGGFTCPNRDGTLGIRGCIFCSASGSGDFAVTVENLSQEIEMYETETDDKGRKKYVGYVAYFQAFTNTYGEPERLYKLYDKALGLDKIKGVSIGTRPDCMGEEVIEVLLKLKEKYPDKFIWIELGLQSVHEKTAEYIRRGYPLKVYEEAVERLEKAGIPYITHLIIGLPFETKEMILDSVRYVAGKKPFGIKLQLLHVLKNTDLATEFENKKFETLTEDEYIDILTSSIKIIDKDTVIHRITGDGAKSDLISPLWSGHKKAVLNRIHHELKLRNIKQGMDSGL